MAACMHSADVLSECVPYLFLLQLHPSSPSAGSEDSLGGRGVHTAAALQATPGRKTGSSTWTPAVKTSTKGPHQSFRNGRAEPYYTKKLDRNRCTLQLLYNAPWNKQMHVILSLRISPSSDDYHLYLT